MAGVERFIQESPEAIKQLTVSGASTMQGKLHLVMEIW